MVINTGTKQRFHIKIKQIGFILIMVCLILCFIFSLTTIKLITADFIDINDGVNGTGIFVNTPTFNWTRVSNASDYALQVANDSGFTDLVVNITNISSYNYPAYCTISATEVTFTLPSEYALTDYKIYYCRVWSYEKQ